MFTPFGIAALLLDLRMQQFPTACMWLYEVKISSQGLPGAFASCVVPEGFRDGVYAQGPSHGLQQSAAAECSGGG